MRAAAFAALLCACSLGTAPPGRPVLTRVDPLAAGKVVWIVGIARNAKLGAAVEVGGAAVHCGGRPLWAADVEGRPVVVAGTLTKRTFPPPPVGPGGERSAGPEGAVDVLDSCAVPPADDDDELLGAERAVMAAIARRDRGALGRLVGRDFVLRVPGQPDVGRDAFLEGTSALPEGIVVIAGEGMVVLRSGEVGIVRGVQVAKVKLGGRVVEDRGVFADVFVRRGGVWVLTFALSVAAGG